MDKNHWDPGFVMSLSAEQARSIELHEELHRLHRARFSRCRGNASSPLGPFDAQCGEWPAELSSAWLPCRDPEAERAAAFRAADESLDAGEWSSGHWDAAEAAARDLVPSRDAGRCR